MKRCAFYSFLVVLFLPFSLFALSAPESVAFDSLSNRYFVSNSGDGSIDEIRSDGTFLKTFAKNGENGVTLTKPLGMTVTYRRINDDSEYKGYLAVADTPFVRLLDMESGKEAKRWDLSKFQKGDKQFLNDVTVDCGGSIYVSDSMGGQVFRINLEEWKPEIERLLDIPAPNGLYIDENETLFVVTSEWWVTGGKERGNVYRCPSLGKFCVLIASSDQFMTLDGIVEDQSGNLIITDWHANRLFSVDKESGEVESLANWSNQKADPNPADLTILEDNTLLIPFMGVNEILKYDLGRVSQNTTSSPWMLVGKWEDLSLKSVENHPVKDSSWEKVLIDIVSIPKSTTPGITNLLGTVTLGCKLPKDPMDFEPKCYSSKFIGSYDEGNGAIALNLKTSLPYFGDRLIGFFDLKKMKLRLKSGADGVNTFEFNFSPNSEFTKVIGHRGDSDHYPENTLLSFKNAAEGGVDIIELDIHLSKDGIPVVMHDADLSRTTNGTGTIETKTVKELKELSAGFSAKFGDKFKDEKIPTLREVFENLPLEQVIFVEIKREAVNKDSFEASGEYKALELAREFKRLSSTVFISFEELAVKRLVDLSKKTGERIQTGFIASPNSVHGADPIQRSLDIGVNWGVFSKDFRSGNPKLNPPFPPNPIFGSNKKGLKLAFWTFGEPDVKEALQYLTTGVDAVASNSPKETRLLLNKYKKSR